MRESSSPRGGSHGRFSPTRALGLPLSCLSSTIAGRGRELIPVLLSIHLDASARLPAGRERFHAFAIREEAEGPAKRRGEIERLLVAYHPSLER